MVVEIEGLDIILEGRLSIILNGGLRFVWIMQLKHW